jgi:hypothetical protein
MTPVSELNRFVDDGRTLSDFADHIVVVCPRCSADALVQALAYGDDEVATPPVWLEPRRLTCMSCGLARDWTARHTVYGTPVDPYFQLPLALQAPCAGHLVWAYNLEHIHVLHRFVEATQRTRTPGQGRQMSLVERLPGWFTSAKNRDAVSRALQQIAAAHPRPGPATGRARG